MSHHCVVWTDHSEARIFELTDGELRAHTVKAHPHGHSPRTFASGHLPEDKDFYRSVVGELAQAKEILVVGPATAKLDLLRFAHEHAPDVEKRVLGVETVDHPTDGQLLAYAKKYFKAADHMH
jgi:stalled ribosome rescue protein Dom34